MSRSYKKSLWWKCGSSFGWGYGKKEANRKVRRTKGIPDGKAYKKFFCSWNICDGRSRYNPYPWIHCDYRTGEMEWVEPDPLWKVRMK